MNGLVASDNSCVCDISDRGKRVFDKLTFCHALVHIGKMEIRV
jgi:hypothetical protein